MSTRALHSQESETRGREGKRERRLEALSLQGEAPYPSTVTGKCPAETTLGRGGEQKKQWREPHNLGLISAAPRTGPSTREGLKRDSLTQETFSLVLRPTQESHSPPRTSRLAVYRCELSWLTSLHPSFLSLFLLPPSFPLSSLPPFCIPSFPLPTAPP